MTTSERTRRGGFAMWIPIALAMALAGLAVWWLSQPVPPALLSQPVAPASNDVGSVSKVPVVPTRQPIAEQASPTVEMLRLVDAVTEQPIAMCAVKIQGAGGERSATTDERGQLAAEGLASNWLHVVGYLSAWVEPGTSVVAMQPVRSVPGRVEGWNGSYETFTVFPQPLQQDPRSRSYGAMSVDSAGHFVFQPRFPGPHSFGLTSFGNPPVDLAETEWSPGQPEIVLRVPAPASGERTLVRVRIHVDQQVRDEMVRRRQVIVTAGLEVAPKLGRSDVSLVSSSGEVLHVGNHDLEVAEGELTVEVPSGEYRPILDHRRNLIVRGAASQCRGAETVLDLRVGGLGTLEVDLVGWGSRVPTGGSVAFVTDPAGDHVAMLSTFARGGEEAKRIDHRLVPPGDCFVWCVDDDAELAARPQQAKVVAGGTQRLLAELGPAGSLRVDCGDLVGRLRRLCVVDPASKARLSMTIPPNRSGVSRETAVYLPRGVWGLEASLTDGHVIRRDVEVGAGVTRHLLQQ